jgi:hypothetical protein
LDIYMRNGSIDMQMLIEVSAVGIDKFVCLL